MKVLHPLLNPNSPHYTREDGKVGIEEMEKETSIREAIGFARCSIFKYKFRKDHKGQKASDEKKIKTYELYLGALLSLLQKGVDDTISVSRGWELVGQEWSFR